MATIEKTVRFYDTILIDEHDNRLSVEADFWTKLLSSFASWDLASRSGKISDVDYLGLAVSPKRPALPHMQVERIRDLTEQLNRSNVSNGDVEPLDFDDPNDRVSEPTFIVPFGAYGRVAVMSPAVQGTRPETLARWLTSVLDLVPKGYSLELVPVVDPEILEKIQNADGAVMLEVHVDAGAQVPASGGGAVGDAFRNAQHQALQDARLVFRWSLDRSGGNRSVRETLRTGAEWVVTNAFSSNAKVKLADEVAGGQLKRDDERNLFEDRITKNVTFHTTAGERTSDEVILNAVGEAIREFMKGGTAIGLQIAGTSGSATIAFDGDVTGVTGGA
ncbi:MAG TPA: hypothetical protein VNJ54_18765 [Plantibacter sp.]|uniref:hypothetical protein n=1 Tax=unclassified Plantibacter TaxID=2624265 RepID=UPI002BAFD4E2|nr:hypothetical protein [Plantibacter sp.]